MSFLPEFSAYDNPNHPPWPTACSGDPHSTHAHEAAPLSESAGVGTRNSFQLQRLTTQSPGVSTPGNAAVRAHNAHASPVTLPTTFPYASASDTKGPFSRFPADPGNVKAAVIPDVPQFSAATQEILRSAGPSPNVAPGTPEWEAARQQVISSMAAAPSGNGYTPGGRLEKALRGRGRGRPRKNAISVDGLARADPGIPHSGPWPSSADGKPKRGRGGRPRSRARGGRMKSGKRKRAYSDEDGDDVREIPYTDTDTPRLAYGRINESTSRKRCH